MRVCGFRLQVRAVLDPHDTITADISHWCTHEAFRRRIETGKKRVVQFFSCSVFLDTYSILKNCARCF